jgi:hypothetical protein
MQKVTKAKKKKKNWGGMAQVVEHPHSKHETLNSNHKKKKRQA